MDGWMNEWMRVPAAGCPSVHPFLSEEATSCVTSYVTKLEDGREDCFGVDGNDDSHTHSKKKKLKIVLPPPNKHTHNYPVTVR